MLKTKRYYFNEQTFTYEPVEISRREVYRTMTGLFTAGLVVAGLFIAITLSFFQNPEEHFLQQEQAVLLRSLNQQNEQLAALESRYDELHLRDNSFYRSILNLEKLDDAIWAAGVGGAELSAARVEAVRNSEALRLSLQHKATLQDQSYKLLLGIAHSKKAELRCIPAIRPNAGRLISGFGWRANPFHGGSEFHQGLDFSAPIGTPIYVTGDGVVQVAGSPESGYGLQVEVNHGFGYVTKYAHMSYIKVAIGDTVKRGQVIGLVGNTGYSTGPHLHYEVIKNGVKINPIDFFYNE